jgi:PST family polysaccharide transporter
MVIYSVGAGYQALIQGCRRIRDLALLRIQGALAGVVLAVPIIYFLGETGVAWAMLATGAAAVATTWWFGRRIALEPIPVSWRSTRREARGLLTLGLAFMASGLLAAGVGFASKVFVSHYLGLFSVGIFAASTTLSSLYVGTVLQAIGTDFYPRLTKIATDNGRVNQLVNEQVEVSVLLAAPGVVATLVFAPLALSLFYSREFVAAAEILRWQILGAFGRVVCLPLSYIALAKARKREFVYLEVFLNVGQLLLLVVAVYFLGQRGLGVAFFLLYLAYYCPVYLVASRLSGFSWSRASGKLALTCSMAVISSALCVFLLPPRESVLVGSVLLAVTTVYSARSLFRLSGSPSVDRLIDASLKLLPGRFRDWVSSRRRQGHG